MVGTSLIEAPRMDLAQWFESLDRAKVESFVDDMREEDLQLDFKTVLSSSMKNADKTNFAKALSGFANSSGGLIVWGIDARKNNRGIDCACEPKPLDDVHLFHSKLIEFTSRFVSPPVDGVQHKKIETTGSQGYEISLIPESYACPHMAKGGDVSYRYYKRSGDTFYPMEHFDLEDMFGRRKKPKLLLQARGKRSNTREVQVILGLKNLGRGTAKYPYVTIHVQKPYSINPEEFDHDFRPTLRRLAFAEEAGQAYHSWKYGANADVVIHPDSVCDFAKIDVGLVKTHPKEDLIIHYEVSAEDVRSERGELVFDYKNIIRAKGGRETESVLGRPITEKSLHQSE